MVVHSFNPSTEVAEACLIYRVSLPPNPKEKKDTKMLVTVLLSSFPVEMKTGSLCVLRA